MAKKPNTPEEPDLSNVTFIHAIPRSGIVTAERMQEIKDAFNAGDDIELSVIETAIFNQIPDSYFESQEDAGAECCAVIDLIFDDEKVGCSRRRKVAGAAAALVAVAGLAGAALLAVKHVRK